MPPFEGKIIKTALVSSRPKFPYEVIVTNLCLLIVCAREWKGVFDYLAVGFAVLSSVWFLGRHVQRMRSWKLGMDSYESLVRKGMLT